MSSSPPNSTKLVLIGEDSEESRRLIELYLKSMAVDFCAAADGAAILKSARERHFDLLLIDIGLPDMSGLDVVRTLRGEGFKGPIVSISANCSADDVVEYHAAGCSACLGKPFNRKQFIGMVSALLDIPAQPSSNGNALNAMWAPLAAQFAEQLPARVKELYATFEAQDFSRLAFLAHKVRAAGMFGFVSVSEICAEFETALKEGQHQKIAPLLEKLSNAVEEIKRSQSTMH